MHPRRRLQTMGRCVSTADIAACMPGPRAGPGGVAGSVHRAQGRQVRLSGRQRTGLRHDPRPRAACRARSRAELINQGNTDKADLTPDNYEFGDAGRDADGSQSVPLKPRRKDVLLVDGRMVLTPDGRDLVRVEGRLAKNPSFWTSLVNIVRRYATLGGVPCAGLNRDRPRRSSSSALAARSRLRVRERQRPAGQPRSAPRSVSRFARNRTLDPRSSLDIYPLTFYKSGSIFLVDTRQEDGWRRNLTCCRARSTC